MKKYSGWTVLKTVSSTHWLCRCECGTVRKVYKYTLLDGSSKRCGRGFCHSNFKDGRCINAERLSNGRFTKTWVCWNEMFRRCYNSKSAFYYCYGARGISVCRRWRKYSNFKSDMGVKPKGLSLDRINVNGNYSPSNCRWATTKEQGRNRRNNLQIQALGKRQCLSEWAEEYGVKRELISNRLRRGWDSDKAVSISPHASKRNSKGQISK